MDLRFAREGETWWSWIVVLMHRIYAVFATENKHRDLESRFGCVACMCSFPGKRGENGHRNLSCFVWYGDLEICWGGKETWSFSTSTWVLIHKCCVGRRERRVTWQMKAYFDVNIYWSWWRFQRLVRREEETQFAKLDVLVLIYACWLCMLTEEREREQTWQHRIRILELTFCSSGDDFWDSPLEKKIMARYDHLFGELPCRLII